MHNPAHLCAAIGGSINAEAGGGSASGWYLPAARARTHRHGHWMMTLNPDSDKTRPGSGIPPLPIPSATVVIARDGARGIEVLGAVRSRNLSFARGALVFPGGALDPGDALLAARHGAVADPLAVYRIAAIRELFEETGVLLAEGETALAASVLAGLRSELQAGHRDFAALLADHGLRPALHALAHFAHWITPMTFAKRFSTHFFLAEAPPHQVPRHDGHELVEAFWMAPKDLVAWHREGRYKVMLPTLQSCRRLMVFATVAAARDGLGMEYHPA